jgi:hypothetical protein
MRAVVLGAVRGGLWCDALATVEAEPAITAHLGNAGHTVASLEIASDGHLADTHRRAASQRSYQRVRAGDMHVWVR